MNFQLIFAPANLAKLHIDGILASRCRMAELLHQAFVRQGLDVEKNDLKWYNNFNNNFVSCIRVANVNLDIYSGASNSLDGTCDSLYGRNA